MPNLNLRTLGSAFALVFGLVFIATLPDQSPENFRKYLEDAGYSDVTNISKRPRACTKFSVNYAFTEKDKQGRAVSGEACMSFRFVHSSRED